MTSRKRRSRRFRFEVSWYCMANLGRQFSASPHFSPGGVMMAQEFFPQRVLEHVRAEGKRTSQSAPSTVVLYGEPRPVVLS